MTFDGHANFGYSLVATPPSPATSGTSLVVSFGTGLNFPVPPFNAVVWPNGTVPLLSNSEIIRVTNINGDLFTIVRVQEGTTARVILATDQIANAITAKVLTDIETALNAVSNSLNTLVVATVNGV